MLAVSDKSTLRNETRYTILTPRDRESGSLDYYAIVGARSIGFGFYLESDLKLATSSIDVDVIRGASERGNIGTSVYTSVLYALVRAEGYLLDGEGMWTRYAKKAFNISHTLRTTYKHL